MMAETVFNSRPNPKDPGFGDNLQADGSPHRGDPAALAIQGAPDRPRCRATLALADDSWVADFADPMGLLMSAVVLYGSDGWKDAQYLSLLGEANRTPDPTERFRKLARAAGRVMHEMPIIPLAITQAHNLRKPYVHALDPDPLDAHYFRYTWVDAGWKP
jgi:ABC-type transport system substrate-binding protein